MNEGLLASDIVLAFPEFCDDSLSRYCSRSLQEQSRVLYDAVACWVGRRLVRWQPALARDPGHGSRAADTGLTEPDRRSADGSQGCRN